MRNNNINVNIQLYYMLSTFSSNLEPSEPILNEDTLLLSSVATHTGNERIKNLNKSMNKKRILLLVDLYDWCFYNIAARIKKQLESTYIFDILTTVDFYNNINIVLRHPYDIYLFFYPSGAWLDNRKLQYLRMTGKRNRGVESRIMFCMYDNYIWRPDIEVDKRLKIQQKSTYANIDFYLKECDAYLWGSPKIRDNIYKFYKTLKPNASCMDGVDSKMFCFKEYSKDILTKNKLKIGWIGNSDITINGLQKGYLEIKKYVTDLNENFEFVPLDRQIKLIPHYKVPEYIHNIDIIVCYSTCEGTPNQILEGSSCGRCWVSTDVGVVSAVYNTIENNPTGIIIKKNESAFKSALMTLYNNRQLIIDYGKNGRKAIESKWDWKYRLEGFTRLFEQI